MTVLAHPLNIIIHSKTHLIRLAAGLRPDPLGGELNRTHETTALTDRERVLKKVGQNVGDEKEYKKAQLTQGERATAVHV